MKPTFVNPSRLALPRGYNHGVVMRLGRDASLLCIAGQIGADREGRVVGPTFARQFEQALANVVAVTSEAGGEPECIAKLTIFVTDKTLYEADLERIGEGYRRHMGRHFPAMALVEVKSLLNPDALVEIEALAVIERSSPA